MKLEIVARNASAVWGNIGPIGCVIWRDITVAELERFAAHANALSARFPAYGVVSITTPKLKPPPADVRAAIVKLTNVDSFGAGYKGSTTMILGEGFVASIARAALAGMKLAGGKGLPDHVSKTPEEAAAFLAPRVGIDEAAVTAGMRELIATAT